MTRNKPNAIGDDYKAPQPPQTTKQSVSEDIICEILEGCCINYALDQVKSYYNKSNWKYEGTGGKIYKINANDSKVAIERKLLNS